MTKKEQIAELNPEAIVWDDLDDAIIGYHSDGKVVYDQDKIIDILMERDGMTSEDAIEHFHFNIGGAHVGEYTPLHIIVL